MLRLTIALIIFLSLAIGEPVTMRKNNVLSRKKRYLVFPEGSNFVTTMSYVKSVMVRYPRGINVLGECDVPFKLPSDARIFRKKHKTLHNRQRREVFDQLEDALTEYGLDGNACLRRIMCDVNNLTPQRGQSLVADILQTIFGFEFEDDSGKDEYSNACHNSTYDRCDFPILDYVIRSMQPK